MTEKENKWIKFFPSLDLPKERVSIAYDTHDERGVRYAYGYFQFYNGTCGCFWKDVNEQPKVVKAEDIKYWMPVPSFDVQEEPVSEDIELEKELNSFFYPHIPWGDFSETERDDIREWSTKIAKHFAKWQKEQLMKNVVLETDVLRDSDGDGVETPYESWLTLSNTEIPELPESLGLKEGDKVKIVIVKSE